jgi:hypothetical protein
MYFCPDSAILTPHFRSSLDYRQAEPRTALAIWELDAPAWKERMPRSRACGVTPAARGDAAMDPDPDQQQAEEATASTIMTATIVVLVTVLVAAMLMLGG